MFVYNFLKYLKMQIMVCGSIGYGGIDEIGRLYSFLLKEDFGIVDHLVSKGADYSDIKDFRDKELSHQIVNHDLEYVKKLLLIHLTHLTTSLTIYLTYLTKLKMPHIHSC
jgi:hypothetical protein